MDSQTGDIVVAWARHALIQLADAREEIDRLNVFPVPDGDTGTNMYLTLESAVLSMESLESDRPDGRLGERLEGADARVLQLLARLQALARGALLGARGNSGVILSQILRGLLHADTSRGIQLPHLLATGLAASAEMAYSAVSNPLEGTMLTVIRVAAEEAGRAEAAGEDESGVVLAAADGARRALAQTPELLPALAEAGVVDSGGRGVTVLLDALAEVITGKARPIEPARAAVFAESADHAHRPDIHYDGPAYEVMFLLDAPDDVVPVLREQLSALGDSLVVVGGDGLWNIHVHVDDAGAAIEAGLAAGRPHRIRVQWLREGQPTPAGTRRGRAVVAVSHGEGVAELLRANGVVAVHSRPRISPSTGEMLQAIEATGAAEVILLPGGKDIRPPAEAAAARAREMGIRVAVIPTRAIVQSMAAIAVHESERGFDDDVAAMSRAAGATRYGGVTVSSKTAMTSAGMCQPGDVLGLVNGDIVRIGSDELEVARQVVSDMVRNDSELITLLSGTDLPESDLERLAEELEDEYPGVEVLTEDGGQPLWPVIIGVE